jgi:hypothetical protein
MIDIQPNSLQNGYLLVSGEHLCRRPGCETFRGSPRANCPSGIGGSPLGLRDALDGPFTARKVGGDRWRTWLRFVIGF